MLRLGIWGLGRGLHIVRTARDVEVDIVAGCDFNPHFLESFQKAIPHGRFTADPAEFLSWDFDAVLLATFCPAHAPHAIQCLEAGKHVLSEVTAFHTPAEGVALVEAVERTGRIYQLAENYPYTPENRWLAQRWREGLFGDLQYAEYSYIHDCLNLAYTYIDGTPVEPGWTVHNWRSWLPWHFYNTHSLGPVMVICGVRPVRVTALPGRNKIPGHLMPPPEGLCGMAPSLIEMDNGALMRNLMGGATHDRDFKILYGTRGASELLDGRLSLRLGGRGHSPAFRVIPDNDELGRRAAATGHGGADFWVLYHFANEILHGIKGPFDVYAAADVTLPGILAYRSARAGGQPLDIPNFRLAADRDAYRDDHGAPPQFDTQNGLFPESAARPQIAPFTRTMKDLLECADVCQAFDDWSRVFDSAEHPEQILELGDRVLRRLTAFQDATHRAQTLATSFPDSAAARVLNETLARFQAPALVAPDARARWQARRDALARRLPSLPPEQALTIKYPQLRMKRIGFDALPPIELPPGFSLRTYQPALDGAWETIIGESFGEPKSRADFEQSMLRHAGYAPDRLFYILDPNGVPCATAAAFGDSDEGYVHFVGTRPTFAGHKLGYWVSLAVLHKFAQRNLPAAILDTDDHRVPAVKTYARLGFRPYLTHPSHAPRWRALAASLNLPDLDPA